MKMTEEQELQNEEREVLLSIYDGDPAFKQLSPTVFQYKYGEDQNDNSFVLEIEWGCRYPIDKPAVNMNAFYNSHVVQSVKDKITSAVLNEAEQFLGSAMTYSLFEFVKEKYLDFLREQPQVTTESVTDIERPSVDITSDMCSKKCLKKEHLTKAQKRRQWNKVDSRGDKPRGWNWVDIIKHLSQTGSKDNEQLPVT